jgi:hypothetical protein
MRTRERWSFNRRGCPAPTRAMRVRLLPTVLPHARKRVCGYCPLTTAQVVAAHVREPIRIVRDEVVRHRREADVAPVRRDRAGEVGLAARDRYDIRRPVEATPVVAGRLRPGRPNIHPRGDPAHDVRGRRSRASRWCHRIPGWTRTTGTTRTARRHSCSARSDARAPATLRSRTDHRAPPPGNRLLACCSPARGAR